MNSQAHIDPARFEACAREIAAAGHALGALGWTPATSSNFSMRLDADHAAVTISGRDKGQLTVADIMAVDLDGRALDPLLRPSAETALHTWPSARLPVLRNTRRHGHDGILVLQVKVGGKDGLGAPGHLLGPPEHIVREVDRHTASVQAMC